MPPAGNVFFLCTSDLSSVAAVCEGEALTEPILIFNLSFVCY